MIVHTWSAELVPDDLAVVDDLLAEAVVYDEEAGFSTAPSPAEPGPGSTWHGVVRLVPRGDRGDARLEALPDDYVVAYLRLGVDAEGTALAHLVVRPALRSMGVATLLMEQLLEPDEGGTGWADLGVARLVGWAHGSHPAADRMANRFGAVVDREIHKVLRIVGGRTPFEPTVDPVVERESGAADLDVVGPDHASGLAPADRASLSSDGVVLRVAAGSGAAGTVRVAPSPDGSRRPALLAPGDRGDAGVRAVLEAGLVDLQASGSRLVLAYIDTADTELLRVSRELELVHDQSDLRYALDLART